MRCMNCGWENPENLAKCEKCNSPLGHHSVSKPEPERDLILKGTISEQQVFAEPNFENNGSVCPECGYPLRPDVKLCPNCGYDLCKPKGVKVQMPPASGQKYNATVNPWANPVAGKIFTLKPVAWDNEKKETAELSFVGDSVQLNRGNTDPSNNTITSKVQAEITYDNGSWFLEDKSSQGTTFVQAGKKTAIENGTVIMLGNRKFIFKVE